MTAEQEAMLRKAHQSLMASRVLLKTGLYDFAISRAYYTMFYVSQAFLSGQGLKFSKHGSLLAAFGQHLVKTGIAPAHLHRYLIAAYNARVKGDYDVGGDFKLKDAEDWIAHAEEFIELAEQKLGALPPASDPPQSDSS